MTSVALDTNVLVYLSRLGRSEADLAKSDRADAIVSALTRAHRIVVPGQALGELYNVLTRHGVDRQTARARASAMASAFEVAPAGTATYADAVELATAHKLQVWDALIIAASAAAGCELLLSEDMQDGFGALGVTVVNPVSRTPHPRLTNLLGG